VPAPREGQARDVLVLLKDYKLLFVTSSAGGSSTQYQMQVTRKGIMDDEAFGGQLRGVNQIALGKYHGCEKTGRAYQIPQSMQLAICGGWTYSSQVVTNVQKRNRIAFHCDHVGDIVDLIFAHHQSTEGIPSVCLETNSLLREVGPLGEYMASISLYRWQIPDTEGDPVGVGLLGCGLGIYRTNGYASPA
jgi:hypothetical protein